MEIILTTVIHAPIATVFAVFDDVSVSTNLNAHAVRVQVSDLGPDGRRTADILMRAGSKEWTQTIEQMVREPPTRLATRAWTWTIDRGDRIFSMTTDRRFTAEADRTRVDVTVQYRLHHPLRRPFRVMTNWLQRGATRREADRQLRQIKASIEGSSDAIGTA